MSVDTVKKIEELTKKANEHTKYCVKEIGIDAEVAKKLSYGDFSVRDEKAQVSLYYNKNLESSKCFWLFFKCFVDCFFKRSGFFNEAGEPQRDVIFTKLTAGTRNEALEAIVDKCIQIKTDDQCETAFKVFECYWTDKVKAAKKV